MISQERTLFVTEDGQPVYEIGEEDDARVFSVGSLIVKDAKIVRKKGRWSIEGEISIRIRDDA